MVETEKILSIIKKINESEDMWKAQYVILWRYHNYLEFAYKELPIWTQKFDFSIPSSKNKSYPFSFEQLHSVIPNKDGDFKMFHLVTLISLFQSIPKKVTEEVLSSDEKKELRLAEEIRNCFLHGNINRGVRKAYKDSRRENFPLLSTDNIMNFPDLFTEIENWHELIIRSSNKIKYILK